jgi:hypothetical protein
MFAKPDEGSATDKVNQTQCFFKLRSLVSIDKSEEQAWAAFIQWQSIAC